MFGVPAKMKTDNGPPFNSEDFKRFARTLGFQHQRLTPLWPRANGEAEQFMRNLGKTIRTAITEKKNWQKEMTSYLRNYRATPHCITGVAPATAMFGRSLRTKLPEPTDDKSYQEPQGMRDKDREMKARSKQDADRRQGRPSPPMQPGDQVLLRQQRRTKFTPLYDPNPYVIIATNGTQVRARSSSGHTVTRNVSFFARYDAAPPPPASQSTRPQQQPPSANTRFASARRPQKKT
jgi:hypothetical protein